jgi:hypothetical protein
MPAACSWRPFFALLRFIFLNRGNFGLMKPISITSTHFTTGRHMQIRHGIPVGSLALWFLGMSLLTPLRESASAAEPAFRIPAEQVRAAQELVATYRAQRGDRKSRRPAGLRDLDSPESIQRAVEQSIKDLSGKGLGSVSLKELQYLGDAAFDALVQGTQSDDPQVAKWCCVVLRHHGRRAVAPLCAVLASQAPSFVRSAAAESLGQTFDSDGVPALIAALDDKDVRVSAIVCPDVSA